MSEFSERGKAPEWLVNWWAMEFDYDAKGFVVSKEKAINRKSPSPSGVESFQNVGLSFQPDDKLECASSSSCPHISCVQPLSAPGSLQDNSILSPSSSKKPRPVRDLYSSDSERSNRGSYSGDLSGDRAPCCSL